MRIVWTDLLDEVKREMLKLDEWSKTRTLQIIYNFVTVAGACITLQLEARARK